MNKTNENKSSSNPFDAFRNQIKCNLKNMKKEQESNQSLYPAIGSDNMGNTSPREVAAMAKYHWTEEVPSFMYYEHVKKVDLNYNIL